MSDVNEQQETQANAEASTVLSKLFRQLMKSRNVDEARFTELMNAYMANVVGVVDRKVATDIRGNLGAELVGSTMTWKVFCKGLKFLQIEQVGFAVFISGTNMEACEASETFSL